ncbi:MAG: hypothetical protein CM1200mP18_22080 [Gammaproteobacteria bacterium]|nr:MAG: hypothetical protein CM1200mP18_22080 [Gammaproteobacteria bacterium]
MRLVVGSKIVRVDAQTLAAENVVWTKQVGRLRVFDNFANFPTRELSDRVVCFLVEKKITISTKERQAPRAQNSSYCVRAIRCASRAGDVLYSKKKPVGLAGPLCPQMGVTRLNGFHIFWTQILVMCGD